MRASTVAVLVPLLALAAWGSRPNEASADSRPCRAPREAPSLLLPAPLTITTAGCGAFQLGRDGSVRRTSTNPSPVPRGASWWPSTDVWDKVADGHLIVGRRRKRVWRSAGRFPVAYEVGAIVVGPRALAFSYGNRAPRLYLAGLNGAERRLASGEYPLGWTRDGLYTRRGAGGELLLRTSDGVLRATVARQVYTYAYDGASGDLYFVADGRLVRADGVHERALSSLARLGLTAGGSLQLQPLGRLVALRDGRRLVVLRTDGRVFASTRLPHGRAGADGISSQFTAAPDARAVAFTATFGNSAYGSSGSESVYLLGPGSHTARAVHTERVRFAICERGADLAWHGRWLLYSASEGNTAVIDTARRRRAVELTTIVRSLPGLSGGEGNLSFSAFWGGGRPSTR